MRPIRAFSPTLLLLAAGTAGLAAESAPLNGSTLVVTGERETERLPATASTATRTSTPLQETPQSIQVLPRAILDDQRSLTLTEALTNVSGLRSSPMLNQNLDPSRERLIRGFNAETYRNGMPLFYNAGDRESLANVERVEVLKGPSALLFGSGVGAPTGGLINLVLKQPEEQAHYAAGINAGSYGLLSGNIDLNQPLDAGKTVLTRVTAEVGQSRSHIDTITTERGSVDPTIALRNAHGTTLTLHGRWSQRLQQDYPNGVQLGHKLM